MINKITHRQRLIKNVELWSKTNFFLDTPNEKYVMERFNQAKENLRCYEQGFQEAIESTKGVRKKCFNLGKEAGKKEFYKSMDCENCITDSVKKYKQKIISDLKEDLKHGRRFRKIVNLIKELEE